MVIAGVTAVRWVITMVITCLLSRMNTQVVLGWSLLATLLAGSLKK